MAGKTIRKERKKKDKKPKLGIVIVIVILLCNAIPLIFNLVDEFSYSMVEVQPEYEVDLEDDVYAWVTRELSEHGETYEVTLTSGMYKGGVHIPEGTYDIMYIPNEPEEGYMDLHMNDCENGIYYSVYFGEYEGVYQLEDYRIYEDGIMEIQGTGALWFYSENAQIESMEMVENPNTTTYEFDDTFVVGVDMEPGVYDIYYKEYDGLIEYDVEHSDGYYIYFCEILGDPEYGYADCLKNMVLPEGTEISVEMPIILVPSEYIESEDYQGFYNNY